MFSSIQTPTAVVANPGTFSDINTAIGAAKTDIEAIQTATVAAQVGAGMAWVYTPYASAHPHLARLQQQARASRKGLWAQPRPLAPWSYRQRHQR